MRSTSINAAHFSLRFPSWTLVSFAVNDSRLRRHGKSRQRVFPPLDHLLRDLLAQFDGIERFILGQTPQDGQCVRSMSPSATAAITFRAADSIFSMACAR